MRLWLGVRMNRRSSLSGAGEAVGNESFEGGAVGIELGNRSGAVVTGAAIGGAGK